MNQYSLGVLKPIRPKLLGVALRSGPAAVNNNNNNNDDDDDDNDDDDTDKDDNKDKYNEDNSCDNLILR